MLKARSLLRRGYHPSLCTFTGGFTTASRVVGSVFSRSYARKVRHRHTATTSSHSAECLLVHFFSFRSRETSPTSSTGPYTQMV